MPELERGLKCLINSGYDLFIVTNQAGIARGYYSEETFHKFMVHILSKLEEKGIKISGYEYCPHHEDGIVDQYKKKCTCRKPNAEMIKRILVKQGVAGKDCIIIGDKLSDLIAGQRAGIKSKYLLKDVSKIDELKDQCENMNFYHVKNWVQFSLNIASLKIIS